MSLTTFLIGLAIMLIAAVVLFKIVKWVSMVLILAILGLGLAYHFSPEFKEYVSGQVSEQQSTLKSELEKKKDELIEKAKQEAQQRIDQVTE